LVIKKFDTTISIVYDDKMLESNRTSEGEIFGIVGIINVSNLNFLAVITQVKQVGVLNKAQIKKIS
jgi:hypothetical protein